MNMLSMLESQQYEKDLTASAVWAPEGVTYDGLIIFARQVPKIDNGQRVGVQMKIRMLLNADARGIKVTKAEVVEYPAGSEVNLFIDAGQKTTGLVNGMKAAGLTELLAGTRLIFRQQGSLPANSADKGPTKLYQAQLAGPHAPESTSCPLYQQAIARAAEEDAKEAQRLGALTGTIGGTPAPMAAQGAPAPMMAAAPAPAMQTPVQQPAQQAMPMQAPAPAATPAPAPAPAVQDQPAMTQPAAPAVDPATELQQMMGISG